MFGQMRTLARVWREMLATEREALAHIQTAIDRQANRTDACTRRTVQPSDGPTLG